MKIASAIKWGALCLICAVVGFAVASLTGPSTTQSRIDLLMNWLNVTAQQRQAIEQADPTFIPESASLVHQLQTERAKLAAMLRAGDPTSAISAQLQATMAVEEKLEQRSAQFVMTIRPLLDPHQQKMLLELVADGLTSNAGSHLRDPITEPAASH